LQRLARDPEPAVAALALGRLLAIDPDLVAPVLGPALASPDARVRALGVEALFLRPTGEHVRLLGERLDDPHLDVRRQARRRLQELAGRKQLRDPVITEAMRHLAGKEWRALEQATILLPLLDHKPAAQRLLDLLTFPRPEVSVTAAWGLRRLAVPGTLPRVVSHLETEVAETRGDARAATVPDVLAEAGDLRRAQLLQLLGRQKYAPAEALLREFPPKELKLGAESRAAGVWALGLLLEGKQDPKLAALLIERLRATHEIPPEDRRVRLTCAGALGRLKAEEAVPSLELYYGEKKPSLDPIGNACGWSLAQITGRPMAAAEPIKRPQLDWFLAPYRPSTEKGPAMPPPPVLPGGRGGSGKQ
jgi:HEAT repeat protein